MSLSERDWVRVVAEERCHECGLRASTIPRHELGPTLQREVGRWASMLGGVDVSSLQSCCQAGRWSALEYGAHVRDVLRQFRQRVAETATGSKPDFGWWDHEAAVVADRYNEQDPGTVAAELAAAALELVEVLDGLDEAAWQHSGTRRGTEVFTVEGFVRFAVHETFHHRVDAVASLDRRTSLSISVVMGPESA